MKKLVALAATLLVGTCLQVNTALAAEGPTCVLMKFTDDTRFDQVDSAATLSDLVMEKLLTSGKFNFKETKVIDEDLEKRLYNERAEEFANAKWAMEQGDFSVLFEGAGFNEMKAQSIATAAVGQMVSPSIIASIGQANGADYLIQGTIQNIGSGNWMNDNIKNIINGVNMASGIMGSAGVSNLLGALGPFSSLADVSVKETGIGVQAELRLIKASTGKVVWHKSVIGSQIEKQTSLGGIIKIGDDKLDSEMYYGAMEKTAQLVADELIAEYDAGKLFVE